MIWLLAHPLPGELAGGGGDNWRGAKKKKNPKNVLKMNLIKKKIKKKNN
jgi:hypothetical protein